MKRITCIAALIGLAICGCDTGTTPTGQPPGGNTGKGPEPLSCQTFSGISHCTIGSTILTLNLANLIVTNFNAAGSDGVSSSWHSATHWSQTADIDFPASGGSVAYSATAGGAAITGLSMTQTAGAVNTYAVTPSFTGAASPTFDVTIYNGGSVSGSQASCLIGNNVIVIWPIALVSATTDYRDIPGSHQAEWTLLNAGTGTFSATLPNGTNCSGTKLVITEHSTPTSGAAINGVNVTGYLDSYKITAESAI